MQCKVTVGSTGKGIKVTGRQTAVLYIFIVMPVTVLKQGVEGDTI